MKYFNYTIVIEPDEDAFHAYVPALRGCHSIGDTPEEAKANIKEAIELYLESLLAHNEEIPIEHEPMLVEKIEVGV
ncbi:MAG: type II toxin-antitoxin system HicB family antitoxin [Candidatus Kapaibacterium sp.]